MENNTEQTEEVTAPVQLTLGDMQALSSIIDLASRRGAFHASEMTQVGAAFNKLTSFLEAVAEQQKTDEEASSEDSE